MTIEAKLLAAGPGWRVQDMVCAAGPQDRPFEERHNGMAVAIVTSGTFLYRARQGSALLGPGAILLGNHGQCFECGHEHASGDRCLSFHFTPDYWEELAAGVPGVRSAEFTRPHLPPAAALLPLTAAAEASRDADPAALEEASVEVAGAAMRLDKGGVLRRGATARDERRISAALRLIETTACDPESRLSLGQLARQAGMSPYHFLRRFRDVVGMTPYQYVLQRRMQRAAVSLRRTTEPIAVIAFDAGFNDLSTFNRRFRKLFGASPRAFRSGG